MSTSGRYKFSIRIMGNDAQEFYSKSGLLLAVGYQRIVIGGRGPYVEFSPRDIELSSFRIPKKEMWRVDSDDAFYVERRSKDDSDVKLYDQKKLVTYADYKIGFYYISPADLIVNGTTCFFTYEPTPEIESFFD
jgi:hypothetical protein